MNPLLIFLIVPVLEIALFIQVGDWIGLWPTVLLVILAAFLGTALIRRQGLSVLRRAQTAADRGEAPVGAVFEGFCIVVAGVLLIIPGFLTDIVGLALFVPFLRNALGRWLLDRLRRGGGMRVWVNGRDMGDGSGRSGGTPRPPPGVIDAEYREVRTPDDDVPEIGQSRWRPGPRGDGPDPR